MQPAVLVAHTAIGPQDQFITDALQALAQEGYAAFALDLFGAGHTVLGEEKQQYNAELQQQRNLIAERALAALDLVKGFPGVDAERIAAIGYCLGGKCVLDLLRAAAPDALRAVVSFHGILDGVAVKGAQQRPQARVVAFHGHEDPFATNAGMIAFAAEMEQRQVDYEVRLMGANVLHAFMRPDKTRSEDERAGLQYHATVSERAWADTVCILRDAMAAPK